MTLDPTVPDPSGAAAMRALEQRVEALERANQMLASTVQGGLFTVQNADGLPVARIGHYNSLYGHGKAAAGGTDGIRLTAPNLAAEILAIDPDLPIPPEGLTIFEMNDADGQVFPSVVVPWRKEWDYVTAPRAEHTSPGDWFNYFSSWLPIMHCRSVRFLTYFQGSLATTWEFQAILTNFWGTDTTDTFTVENTTTGYIRELSWDPSNAHIGVGSAQISLRARRTAGTGTATVFAPHAQWWSYPIGYGSAGAWQDRGTF